MSEQLRIAVVPGDGIGVEVIARGGAVARGRGRRRPAGALAPHRASTGAPTAT